MQRAQWNFTFHVSYWAVLPATRRATFGCENLHLFSSDKRCLCSLVVSFTHTREERSASFTSRGKTILQLFSFSNYLSLIGAGHAGKCTSWGRRIIISEPHRHRVMYTAHLKQQFIESYNSLPREWICSSPLGQGPIFMECSQMINYVSFTNSL